MTFGRLAEQIKTGRQSIRFQWNSRILDPDALVTSITVDPDLPITAELLPARSFGLRLVPKYPLRTPLERRFEVPDLPTMRDLFQWIMSRVPLNLDWFIADGRPIAPDDRVAQFPDNHVFKLSWDFNPADILVYSFNLVCLDGLKDNRRLVINPMQTVCAVKKFVLHKFERQTCLPSTIRLQFWGCELDDLEKLISYEIPQDGTLEVIELEAIKVQVVSATSEQRVYESGVNDDIAHLSDFCSHKMGYPVQLLINGQVVDGGSHLVDFVEQSLVMQRKSESEPAPVQSQLPIPSTLPPSDRDLIAYRVCLDIAEVLRVVQIRLPPSATVADAEAAAREIWSLRDLVLQIALYDVASDTSEPLSGTTLLTSIDLTGHSLILGAPVSHVSAPIVEEFPAPPRSPHPLRLCHADVAGADEIEYSFAIPVHKTTLKFAFPPTATVRDAKWRIAAHFHIPEGDVADLLFAGKALKDTFLLSRLRIGTRSVTVQFIDTSEVLLYSPFALRCRQS
jgi:hypothetical protein